MTQKHFVRRAAAAIFLSTLCTGTIAAQARIDEQLARSVVDRIALDVERLRGLEFKTTVPVSVVDDDQAMAHHLRRMEEFGALDDLRRSEVVLKALGLAAADDDVLRLLTDALREQVGGFYDPKADRFYLLDDMPAAMIDVLTAHELTHALEDQYYGLDALLESGDADDDQVFARGCVAEGSATLLMSMYTVEQAFGRKFGEDEVRAMSAIGRQAMDAMPEVLTRELIAPYILGLSFVQRGNALAWMGTGFPVEDINRIYDNPPLSSEQILHPEKYWVAAERDDPVAVSLGNAGSALGGAWTRVHDGVLGEINLALLVGARTPDPADPEAQSGSAWTDRAAAGWGGDHFELWTRGKKSIVLLSTVWDSEQDAEQFVEALTRSPVALRSAGRAVALVYGDARPKKLDGVLAGMLREAARP